MATRLGLDVGTNSLGWCLLEVDEQFEPTSIIDTGVRIFSDGRNVKSHTSLKAERRTARQARRMRDRFLRRRNALMNALVKHGLMPDAADERKDLEGLNPYFIRRDAIEKKCPPHHIGRALFHLNQRRGFKSNRKTADNEAGVVKQSIARLETYLSETGKKTVGAYLADRSEEGKTVRARRQKSEEIDPDKGEVKKVDIYELYPSRALIFQDH